MKNKTTEIEVKDELTGERLDKALAPYFEALSRNQIQALIKDGLVTVDGATRTPHYSLKAGEKIIISKAEEKKAKKIKTKKIAIKKIYEDDNLMVVVKPAGLITHPASDLDEVSLSGILSQENPKLIGVGESPMRPGIVHRLDKEASGLLVVAKNQEAFSYLKKQFTQRKIYKKYTALVHGAMARETGEINFLISRSKNSGKMAAKPENQEGKEAVTQFNVIEKFTNFTLLEVIIKTGRTHQIRCHLAAIGFPIVGDNLYGTPKTREKNEKLETKRIFLESSALGFKDLTGTKKSFKIPLSADLKKILDKIK